MRYFLPSVIALIPAFLLCFYIYRKDRVEKEPTALLIGLFCAGAFGFLAIFPLENWFITLADRAFSDQISYHVSGYATFSTFESRLLHAGVCSFGGVALLEETAKWGILCALTAKNKNFTHCFDGVVYSVFVSLGFAAAESLRYAIADGWDTLFLRSLSSLAPHLLFGILMGVFYTVWNAYRLAGQLEKKARKEGHIPPRRPFLSLPWLALSLFVPLCLHGFYYLLRLLVLDRLAWLFFGTLIFLYIGCFRLIGRVSAFDQTETLIAYRLLYRKYPHLHEIAPPRAYSAFYFDYPEYFWLSRGFRYTSNRTTGEAISAEIQVKEFWEYTLSKEGYWEDLVNRAGEIAALASACENTYETVKFVHDYLITHTVYDQNAARETYQSVQSASTQLAHTAYGSLVSQSAVCDGYAKGFQLIMNLLGIECEYIEGDAGGGHAWNYLCLEDEDYWMDVTWDDADQTDYPDYVQYDYFCITDEELYRTHTPEEFFSLPVCTATEYNFFHHENAYFVEYDFEAFSTALSGQLNGQYAHFRFKGEEQLNAAIADLFEQDRFFTIPEVTFDKISYSQNPKQSTLTLILG